MVKQALNAWMNGELVGTWAVERNTHTFHYAPSWIESEHSRSLSLSLPLNPALSIQGSFVKNYFDNLLPDNKEIRERLGKRYKLQKANTFSLLQAIGRDCVGAVQLLPEGDIPEGWDQVQYEPWTEETIAEYLRLIPSENTVEIGEEDLFRISIAGAQEKTALLHWNGSWCRPIGATPTTHIVKLPLGLIGGALRVDATDSVENEWLCAQIVAALGLPVADTAMQRFGEQKVLVVERFDRSVMEDGSWIARLPQEDFCQALGTAPDSKYENKGGPGMEDCLRLLQGSQTPDDTALFLLTQLTFLLLAATDGHAKNFSLHLNRSDAYEMTPLYDIISMWPYFGNDNNQFRQKKAGLAMAVRSKNAHYHFNSIHAGHWRQLAIRHGGKPVWDMMKALLDQVEPALISVEKQLPHDFPARTWETISAGMRHEAARFQKEAQTIQE